MNPRMRNILLLAACLAALRPAFAADAADPCRTAEPTAGCRAPRPWFDPTRLYLELADRAGGPHSMWRYEIEDPGNLAITLDDSAHGGPPQGRMMLVGGRFLVTRDIPLQKHHERDPLVIGTLHFQLLVQLLRAAFPDGPQSVTAERTVEIANDKESIAVGTFGATDVFTPPWKLKAKAARVDRQTIDYQLDFSFHTEAAPETEYAMKLRGQWIKDDKAPVLPDDLPLAGWTMHYVGGDPRAFDSGIILEYAERRRKGGLNTLGALRAAARAEPAELAKRPPGATSQPAAPGAARP